MMIITRRVIMVMMKMMIMHLCSAVQRSRVFTVLYTVV